MFSLFKVLLSVKRWSYFHDDPQKLVMLVNVDINCFFGQRRLNVALVQSFAHPKRNRGQFFCCNLGCAGSVNITGFIKYVWWVIPKWYHCLREAGSRILWQYSGRSNKMCDDGEGGVKNRQKLRDIIYGWSLKYFRSVKAIWSLKIWHHKKRTNLWRPPRLSLILRFSSILSL